MYSSSSPSAESHFRRCVVALALFLATAVLVWTVSLVSFFTWQRSQRNDISTEQGQAYAAPDEILAWLILTLSFLTLAAALVCLWLFRVYAQRSEDRRARHVAETQCQALEDLHRTENPLRDILKHTPAVVSVKDIKGRHKLVNQHYLDVIQRQESEVIGKTVFDLFPEDVAQALTAIDERVFRDGRSEVLDQVLPCQDGLHTFLSVKFPMHDANGSVTHVCCISTDITDRLHAEEERKNLEQQVQHARKLESLGVLAGGVAHDFNNILMAILGNADLALHDSSVDVLHERIRCIEKAATAAAGLTRQMLDYSGKGSFITEQVSLSDFVNSQRASIAADLPASISIDINCAVGLPMIEADLEQLKQLTKGLVANAVEAIGEQPGNIWVRTGGDFFDRATLEAAPRDSFTAGCSALHPGFYVYLEVRDDGCGMDAEILARIFEPFFSTKFTGRGLGLPAAVGIVRGHGGCILVDSEVDRGSNFQVLLPPLQVKPNPIVSKTSAKDMVNEIDAGDCRTVLLADDDMDVLDITSKMLVNLGYQVVTAADGQEAVDQFRRCHKDLCCALIDLTMPKLDGEEVCREIYTIREDFPIVLTSGYDESDATRHFYGKGLAGFLQKPFNLTSLRAILDDVLGV